MDLEFYSELLQRGGFQAREGASGLSDGINASDIQIWQLGFHGVHRYFLGLSTMHGHMAK